MFTLNQLQTIATSENVIFYKPNCPFCQACEKLMQALKEKQIISDFAVYYLEKDFDNETLTQMVLKFGWQPESHQLYCAKPQVFMNASQKTEYIGGNFEFYKSRWNLGDDNSGEIKVNGETFQAPNLTNPMRF